MGELDLNAIQERADAATPGPWLHDESEDFMGCGSVFTGAESLLGGEIAAPNGDLYPRSGYSPRDDMVFIANARQDVPALLAEVKRLHSWDGVMSLLDEHYPETIWPTLPDREDRDGGARIISLIRMGNDLRRELAAANAALTSVSDLLDQARVQRDEARAAYARMEAERDDLLVRFHDAAEKADMYREQRNEAIAVTARHRALIAEEIAVAIEQWGADFEDDGDWEEAINASKDCARLARQHAIAPTEANSNG